MLDTLATLGPVLLPGPARSVASWPNLIPVAIHHRIRGVVQSTHQPGLSPRQKSALGRLHLVSRAILGVWPQDSVHGMHFYFTNKRYRFICTFHLPFHPCPHTPFHLPSRCRPSYVHRVQWSRQLKETESLGHTVPAPPRSRPQVPTQQPHEHLQLPPLQLEQTRQS